MDKETFKWYQEQSRRTYSYVRSYDHDLVYPSLGLVNEAGEVAGKIKKVFRDKGGKIDEDTRLAIRDELGDVLWYIAQIASNLDLTLEEIAEANVEKLLSRMERGTLSGDGDNR